MNPSPSSDPLELDPATDAFSLFGLERGPELKRDVLEDAYLRLAALVHPDRFAGADSSTRRKSMELSAAVNEGYQALRDPARRAEYLVKLGGIDLDSSDEGGAPKMNQAFLIEMIERREAVDAAKATGGLALENYRDGVEQEEADTLEQAMDALRLGDTDAAARKLVARRYLQRLLDEIDEAQTR